MRQPLPCPADFDQIASVRSFPEIAEHYTISIETLRRWMKLQPDAWVADRARFMRERQHKATAKASTTAAKLRRQSKPSAATFIGLTPGADASIAGRAADHLKRCRFIPVFDASKVYGAALAGIYVVGRMKLPTADMIALAESKGWDRDEWKRVAA